MSSSEFTPYNNQEPGNLISANDWNAMQIEIKKDIASKIKKAVDEKQSVQHADDSDRLENKTGKEWSEEIVNTAIQQFARRTDYRMLFLRLEAGKTRVVEHNLKMFPLVQIYTLVPFDVVYTEDGDEKATAKAYFYLYNGDVEQRLRVTAGGTGSVEIESSRGDVQFRIPWSEWLALYNVQYDDQSSLLDLEGEFWSALFAKPNDRFDDDDHFHSPYFSMCCGQGRTVYQLKSKREFGDLVVKMVTRATVNMEDAGKDAPRNMEVEHYDFNRLGITYRPAPGEGGVDPADRDARVMLLLKV
jgi:hypothetical protein